MALRRWHCGNALPEVALSAGYPVVLGLRRRPWHSGFKRKKRRFSVPLAPSTSQRSERKVCGGNRCNRVLLSFVATPAVVRSVSGLGAVASKGPVRRGRGPWHCLKALRGPSRPSRFNINPRCDFPGRAVLRPQAMRLRRPTTVVCGRAGWLGGWASGREGEVRGWEAKGVNGREKRVSERGEGED